MAGMNGLKVTDEAIDMFKELNVPKDETVRHLLSSSSRGRTCPIANNVLSANFTHCYIWNTTIRSAIFRTSRQLFIIPQI